MLAFITVINLQVVNPFFLNPAKLNYKAFGRSFVIINLKQTLTCHIFNLLFFPLPGPGVTRNSWLPTPEILVRNLDQFPLPLCTSAVWTSHHSPRALLPAPNPQLFSIPGKCSYFLTPRENGTYSSDIMQTPHTPTCKPFVSADTAGPYPSPAGQGNPCPLVCLWRALDTVLHLWHCTAFTISSP